MGFREKIAAFSSTLATARAEWFGCTMIREGNEFECLFYGIVKRSKMARAGYIPEAEAQMRVVRTVWPSPAFKDQIKDKATGDLWQVDEIKLHKINPEWVLTLIKVHTGRRGPS